MNMYRLQKHLGQKLNVSKGMSQFKSGVDRAENEEFAAQKKIDHYLLYDVVIQAAPFINTLEEIVAPSMLNIKKLNVEGFQEKLSKLYDDLVGAVKLSPRSDKALEKQSSAKKIQAHIQLLKRVRKAKLERLVDREVRIYRKVTDLITQWNQYRIDNEINVDDVDLNHIRETNKEIYGLYEKLRSSLEDLAKIEWLKERLYYSELSGADKFKALFELVRAQKALGRKLNVSKESKQRRVIDKYKKAKEKIGDFRDRLKESLHEEMESALRESPEEYSGITRESMASFIGSTSAIEDEFIEDDEFENVLVSDFDYLNSHSIENFLTQPISDDRMGNGDGFWVELGDKSYKQISYKLSEVLKNIADDGQIKKPIIIMRGAIPGSRLAQRAGHNRVVKINRYVEQQIKQWFEFRNRNQIFNVNDELINPDTLTPDGKALYDSLKQLLVDYGKFCKNVEKLNRDIDPNSLEKQPLWNDILNFDKNHRLKLWDRFKRWWKANIHVRRNRGQYPAMLSQPIEKKVKSRKPRQRKQGLKLENATLWKNQFHLS